MNISMNIEHDLLEKLYLKMLLIRVAEEVIADRYAEQEMRCPVHLCIGQEAVAAGVCANLSINDYVMSGHRSHGHYLAKGGALRQMISEIYGKATGCSKGKGGSMHLIDLAVGFLGATPIVGSTIPIGVGAALSIKMSKSDQVSVIFFGEGATEEGVFHESLNFAALHSLPVVFVCENNFYSVYSPLSVRQPAGRTVSDFATGNKIWNKAGDGNNVEQVYELSNEAISYARSGKGPTLLEFTTYRWREHCGPGWDNTIGYRTEQEYLEWRKLCPIERTEKKLLSLGISQATLSSYHDEIKNEVDSAIQFAKDSPFPSPAELFTEIYR
jgi:pyruvate dehydrogenase E1 component alpha subunit